MVVDRRNEDECKTKGPQTQDGAFGEPRQVFLEIDRKKWDVILVHLVNIAVVKE